jgi:hypothetical protein
MDVNVDFVGLVEFLGGFVGDILLLEVREDKLAFPMPETNFYDLHFDNTYSPNWANAAPKPIT